MLPLASIASSRRYRSENRLTAVAGIGHFLVASRTADIVRGPDYRDITGRAQRCDRAHRLRMMR